MNPVANGLSIVPATPKDSAAEAFFYSNGYCVAKGIISRKHCNSLIKAFKKEVMPFEGTILRSTTKKPENHYFSEAGLMTNPILQIQHMKDADFPNFRASALKLLANDNIQRVLKALFTHPPVMVQSVFYHSSMGTQIHEDSHYFDSAEGNMVGCWIALEDIAEDAGRFMVYPKTHNLDQPGKISSEGQLLYDEYQRLSLEVIRAYKNSNEQPSISDFKSRQKAIREMLKALNIEPVAPHLKKGDVLFFSSKILHGSSSPNLDQGLSRMSLIGHFVHEKGDLVKYQEDHEELNPYELHGLQIHQSRS